MKLVTLLEKTTQENLIVTLNSVTIDGFSVLGLISNEWMSNRCLSLLRVEETHFKMFLP